MYAVFNYVLLRILKIALSRISRKWSHVVVSRGSGTIFWGRGGTFDNQTEHFRVRPKGCLYPITFSIYKNLNISLFPSSVVFYTFILLMNQTDLVYADGGQFLHPTT
jgi:hypothetical protein